MSGVKGRSGRKPDEAVKQLRAQMDETIKAADWRAIWRAAVRAAKKGSVPAIKILVEYRYGAAAVQVEQAVSAGAVAYYLPLRADQVQPASLGVDPHVSAGRPLDPSPGPADNLPD